MKTRLEIVIVGGGSNAWTAHIVRDMLLTPGLQNAQYVLYDINKKASDLTKAFLDKLKPQLGADKADVVSTDNLPIAFRGADYFVITISTGGLAAMAHDLAIPEKFGIFHTVGDTAGPGGWSRLIRNFGVFTGLARDFNRYAPGAVVLNYTNPMATLTDVLSRLCKGPVVGLCHGLFENLEFIKRFYGLKSEEEIAVKYAGVNHFFWMTEAKVLTSGGASGGASGRSGTVDVIADVRKRLDRQSMTDLLREAHKDAMGYSSKREVATELFKLTGAMPYLADRHTCEFVPYYITSPENLKKYKLVRTSIKDRWDGFHQRNKQLKKMIATEIPAEYLTRSRETAADIIHAHSQGKVFIDVGNLSNVGQVSNLPLGPVVETAVRVDSNGFTPLTFGALPEPAAAMVEIFTRVYGLTVDACFTSDKKLALQALRLDPSCARLNNAEVERLGEKLLARTGHS